MPQPSVDCVFQDRPALPRTQAFAVHDADAQAAAPRAIVYECLEARLGLGLGHAVKIDLLLHAEAATRQTPHRSETDTLTAKA